MISFARDSLYFKIHNPLLMLELIKVYEGIKPGAFLELQHIRSHLPAIKRNLKSLCNRLGMFYSDKNGGYITKSDKLLSAWESSSNPIVSDAHRFIGYPSCCVNSFEMILSVEDRVPLVRELYWYYLLRVKSVIELKDYAKRLSYIEHYSCNFDCKETIKESIVTRELMSRYRHFFPRSFEHDLYRVRLSSMRKRSRLLLKAVNDNSFVNLLKNPDNTIRCLRSRGLIESLNLGSDFSDIISELFFNKEGVSDFINLRIKDLRRD